MSGKIGSEQEINRSLKSNKLHAKKKFGQNFIIDENIIDKIIVERLNDGQLEDSPLTLKDLKVIATTFSRVLRGMQHDRIKYQEDIAQEFKKNKIEIPAKALDADLENKIKELEASKAIIPTDKPNDNNDDFHVL